MAHSPENTNLSSFKSIKRESGITKLIIFHMEECKHSDEIMVTKQKKNNKTMFEQLSYIFEKDPMIQVLDFQFGRDKEANKYYAFPVILIVTGDSEEEYTGPRRVSNIIEAVINSRYPILESNFSQQELTDISPQDSTSTDVKNREPMYTYKHVKTTLIVFLDLIRSNKQLKYLYENDYGQLVTEIIKNPDLDVMLKNILSQSGEIMKAMENGENISVKINGNTGPEEPGTIDKIELSRQDQEIIEEITLMGFNRSQVVIAYISCEKDRDSTIATLLNA